MVIITFFSFFSKGILLNITNLIIKINIKQNLFFN